MPGFYISFGYGGGFCLVSVSFPQILGVKETTYYSMSYVHVVLYKPAISLLVLCIKRKWLCKSIFLDNKCLD